MGRTLVSTAAAFAVILFASATVVRAEHDPEHGEACDGGEYEYVCGEILVTLHAESDASIEEVVERQGGSEEDIIGRTEALDLYTIAVPVGSEVDLANQYAGDPDVDNATENVFGEPVGEGETTIPDTAVVGPAGLVSPLGAAILGIWSLLMAAALVLRIRRA